MNAYLSLIDHGYPQNEQHPHTDPAITVMQLLAFTDVHPKLPCEVSWRLAPNTARELENFTGNRPAGGWREFCSLAAGAQFLRAANDAYIPTATLHDVIDESTGSMRTKLLESFTIHLAPPSVAANIFLLMGIHPVWGLRMAAANIGHPNLDYETMRFGDRDTTIFPLKTLQTLQTCVFTMIACIVASLRNLDPEQSYSIDALAALIDAIGQYSRRQAEATLKHDPRGLPVFLTEEIWANEIKSLAHLRSIEITTRGFIDQIFVPAAAVRRFDDATFTVFKGAFDHIRVGTLDTAAQNTALSKFLSDIHGNHQVA